MDEARRWILKDENGQIRGPFSTRKMIRLINEGAFSGDELIAIYPGNKWFPMSQEPEFFDHLLEALSSEGDKPEEQILAEELEDAAGPAAEPVKIHPQEGASPRSKKSTPPPPEPGVYPADVTRFHVKNDSEDGLERKSRRKKSRDDDSNLIIELMDVRKLVKREILKQSRRPFLIFLAVLVGSVTWLFWPNNRIENDDRIHLVPLTQSQQSTNTKATQGKLKQILPAFLRDTYSGYLRSENEFVQLLQTDSRNAEVLSLLCLSYNELWPYAFQDSKDLHTVALAAQVASQVDPGGQNSGVCRVVDLMARGRNNEAKSLVSAILEASGSSQNPPVIFYYLKAVLLQASAEFQTALGYVTSAQQVWPQWIRLFIFQAELQIQMQNQAEAAKTLNRVLAVVPEHPVAQALLGLIEYKQFRKLDRGRELLSTVIANRKDRIPRGLLSKVYLGLAEISLESKDANKSLKYAQMAYSLNSSNGAAKNLIVQIGGVETLNQTKVKSQYLIYEGDQFVREGDCQSAQAHYKAAYEADHKNAMAAMKAAKCLWQLSLSTEAIEWLNKAIVADSKMIEAYVTLADFYTQRYNIEAAARVLTSAQHQSPKSYEVFRGFALVELRRNNPQGAVSFAKKALSLYETDGETYVILARAYLALRDKDSYQLAYQAATKATEIDVNNRQAQVVYAEALGAIQGVDVGVEFLRKLVATYPMVTDYQIALGELLLADERFAQAEEVFRHVTKIEEKPKRALVLLAKSLKNENKSEEAIDVLFQAAILDPADPDPLYQAAIIYLENKRPQEARQQLDRVQRINPSFPLLHYMMGRAAIASGNLEEAINQSKQELQLNPNLAEGHLLAADAYLEMKQYSLAAASYERALRLRPGGAKIYVKIARCYRLAGNYDIAKSMLDLAYKEESGYAEIYKERGQLYEMQSDAQRAIEAYKQYFVLDPNAPDRQQITQRMEMLQRNH